jgi:hypothetical protein
LVHKEREVLKEVEVLRAELETQFRDRQDQLVSQHKELVDQQEIIAKV